MTTARLLPYSLLAAIAWRCAAAACNNGYHIRAASCARRHSARRSVARCTRAITLPARLLRYCAKQRAVYSIIWRISAAAHGYNAFGDGGGLFNV